MRYILLLFGFFYALQGSLLRVPVTSVAEDGTSATIHVKKIDVGMSGFILRHITKEHSAIVSNAVVSAFDANSSTATLRLSDYDGLLNNSLPSGKWKTAVGDEAVFAFGYNRALLIAPNEEIYHTITKHVKINWIHPDLFATTLSYRGHPTPLKEDFTAFSSVASTGLLFFYLNQKVYTVDMKSFAILNISDAPFEQKTLKLPFYSRVEKIDANWFGEGSDELESYEPYYYELLVRYNKHNKALYAILKAQGEKYKDLLDQFEIEDK